MASQTHFIIIFTILFWSLNAFSLHMVFADQQLVAKVCGDSAINDQAGCLKTLSSPQATAATNVNNLVEITMTDGAARAEKTLTFIEEMMKKPSSPAALTALKTCTEVYRNVIKEFKMVGPELATDAMSANYDISLIGPEVDKCVKAMEAATLNVPELVEGNRDLQYYASLGHGMTVNLS
ncbi:hypothetical protein like AT4G24640 [Hibiscus trionum]|uniref:Pectinesterase inhibitor domain-containing protein n=1 Tax=Hibiscus trionum TaxID=183268 RepID=A0A9W7HUZ9_HIBTR|nr:hypothetical protein like AT4G24640 [Hibiscus trionum]